jgi:two-component system NtrC family sensor kinase
MVDLILIQKYRFNTAGKILMEENRSIVLLKEQVKTLKQELRWAREKIDSLEKQKAGLQKSCPPLKGQALEKTCDFITQSLKKDLADLENAEQSLTAQKDLLQTILDAIPDFIFLQDRDGSYISVNRAFCRAMGKPKEFILGKNHFDLFPKKLAALYQKEDQQIFARGASLFKENKLGRGKNRKWLHVVKVPVLEARGGISGILGSGRDITALKKLQEQLTHAQKMESLGQLAAGVAHEINTPLGIILGYAQLLLEDVPGDQPMHADLRLIEKQTRICSKIVADLLNFSRPAEGSISLVDIHGAIDEVVKVVAHTFSLNHVAICKRYTQNLPRVKGDQGKLKQVFVNLLKNAFDAIGSHGTIMITTALDTKKPGVIISIKDNGHGILPEDIKKIFDPFFTTKGPDRGTGLGLSVTFGIIREHEGRIEVFSPPKNPWEKLETGTEFVIRLPINNG